MIDVLMDEYLSYLTFSACRLFGFLTASSTVSFWTKFKSPKDSTSVLEQEIPFDLGNPQSLSIVL